VICELERTVDPLFRRAGIRLDGIAATETVVILAKPSGAGQAGANEVTSLGAYVLGPVGQTPRLLRTGPVPGRASRSHPTW
jgi:hypothetical protein